MLYSGGLTEIIDTVKKHMDFSPVEFTIEANPESVSESFIKESLFIGVNRFSLGLQTHSDKLLKGLRQHTFLDFLSALRQLKSFGVKNISADFMLGLPNQTKKDIKKTAKIIKKIKLNHISVYGLKVEQNTPLERSGFIANDEQIAEFYYLISKKLRRIYNHYEISNFAKSGFECRHNLKYWQLEPYLGVGLSASSYINQKRTTNTSDIKKYLSGQYIEYVEDASDNFLTEYIMLGLRTEKGIDISLLSRYGIDVFSQPKYLKYLKKGVLVQKDGYLKLNKEYFFVQNSILVDLI